MEWDWEYHDVFSPKEVAISTLKRLNSSEDVNESFNLSGVVNVDSNSSTESSFKEGMEELSFSSEVSRSLHKTYSNRNGISPSLEASICSFDQSAGLNSHMSSSRSSTKTCSSPNIHISSVSNVKKVKLTRQSTPIARCQVDRCNLDLSSAKEYHKKHRVCENHSKSSKVVLDGVERRFCQQCSRFHWLSEFDGKKRSCRQRLSDHNARRRKPQRERIQFNSKSPPSSFYGIQINQEPNGQQQVSFVFNNVPMVQTEPTLNSIWDTTTNSHHAAGVFHQGSNTEALDLHRALSLLSSNSQGSCESDFSRPYQPMYTIVPTMAQHGMHSAHHEYWQVYQQSADPHIQESHILKRPYGC